MSIDVEISDTARDYLASLLEKQDIPGIAARMFVHNGGTSKAETCLAFCPPGEEQTSDTPLTFGDLTLYLDAPSLPYLRESRIDLEAAGDSRTLTIKAPYAKQPATPPKELALPMPCVARRVPHGNEVTLPAGAEVSVTQALGGSVTVKHEGNLYRLSPEEAGKVGLRSDVALFETPEDGQISEDQCWQALEQVYDPEIPVSIVSLGLVYELTVDAQQNAVYLRMTLTSPGCGMGDVIAGDARNRLMEVPFVESAEVDIVFDPPWTFDMVSDAARLELGLL
ncbi:iron-sulfur cluster assembly protein [Halomonadaceae bacterium KBTZ08]